MTVEQTAARHARDRVTLAKRAARALASLWGQIDRANIAASWRDLLPDALAELAAAQAAAAAEADAYLEDVVEAAAEGPILPAAFAGVASDGRPLASLLYRPAVSALQQIGAGNTLTRSMATGAFELDMIARTQVADAGRVADGVAVAARPEVTGYVRMIVGKTCSRCIILAGRRYEWNAGFRRHPRCDCIHIPAAESVDSAPTNPRTFFDSLTTAEQDKAFGKAGAEAIRNGADLAQVVNARRGMYDAGGKQFTREAAGRRPRLMPEQILRDARDRDDAIRLLRLHGYIR